jgi:hypothetical protein
MGTCGAARNKNTRTNQSPEGQSEKPEKAIKKRDGEISASLYKTRSKDPET